MNNANFPQIRINKSPQKVSFLPIRINKSLFDVFSYIYITYFLYIKSVFLIDSYSNWIIVCFIFCFFHNHVNLAFVLFHDFTKKLSDVLALSVMVFFGLSSLFRAFSRSRVFLVRLSNWW